MEKYSAAYAAETTSDINFWSQGANICILLPEGLSHFAFRRSRPAECLPNEMQSLFHRGKTYSSGVSEKQKKTKALRSLRPCGE